MTHFRKIDVSALQAVEPVSQPAPQLLWIEIDSLVIDDRYQRPMAKNNLLAVRRIAGDFRWSRFSPVLVAPVEGGGYALIDGQHRAHAAALCGFDRIPAMVLLVAPEEQALAFIEINTRQIRVSRMQIYRAALAAEEGWAVACRDAVAAAGCRLMATAYSQSQKKAKMVFAVALIQKMVEAGKAEAVTRALAALVEYDGASVPNFSDALLDPWVHSVADSTADVPTLVRVLQVKRPWLVLETADRYAMSVGKPKAACRKDAFTALINKVVAEASTHA